MNRAQFQPIRDWLAAAAEHVAGGVDEPRAAARSIGRWRSGDRLRLGDSRLVCGGGSLRLGLDLDPD